MEVKGLNTDEIGLHRILEVFWALRLRAIPALQSKHYRYRIKLRVFAAYRWC